MIHRDDFIGGDLALDFVNTVSGIRSGIHNEGLKTYDDLLDWALAGSILDAATRVALQNAARIEPEAAAHVLDRAKAFRETLYNLFHAAAHRRASSATDLARFNDVFAKIASKAEIVSDDDGFAWRWVEGAFLDRPLWPVVRAAGDLLTSGPLHRLHECASETCGWLFLDVSKSGRRRWCDMRGCGNRAKVRRHRRRIEPPSPGGPHDPTPKK